MKKLWLASCFAFCVQSTLMEKVQESDQTYLVMPMPGLVKSVEIAASGLQIKIEAMKMVMPFSYALPIGLKCSLLIKAGDLISADQKIALLSQQQNVVADNEHEYIISSKNNTAFSHDSIFVETSGSMNLDSPKSAKIGFLTQALFFHSTASAGIATVFSNESRFSNVFLPRQSVSDQVVAVDRCQNFDSKDFSSLILNPVERVSVIGLGAYFFMKAFKAKTLMNFDLLEQHNIFSDFGYNSFLYHGLNHKLVPKKSKNEGLLKNAVDVALIEQIGALCLIMFLIFEFGYADLERLRPFRYVR